MAVKGSVEITLSLKQQKQVLSAYRKVETKLKKSNEAIENSFNKASTSAKNADKGIKSLTSSFTKFIPAAIGVGTALVGAKKAFDFSKEFARFEQSTKAMEMQFGVSSQAVLEKLGNVAKGTISNAELISSANRAMALNVTRDLDQMSQLMEVARVRGQAMGLDTTQAFSDLVTGIGRASPLILDNLGIITKGWDKQAKAAGRAMDASFILDKVLADGAVMLEKTGDVALTNAENFQLMTAETENLKLELGESLLPVVLKVQNGILKLVKSASEYLGLINDLGRADQIADPVALKEAIRLSSEYVALLSKINSDPKRQTMRQRDTLHDIAKEYKKINQIANAFPINMGEQTLIQLVQNLGALTKVKKKHEEIAELERSKIKKTPLAEEKRKEIKSLRPDLTEEVRQRTELDFEIRQLVLEAQEETEKQKIDLVKLQYEKERNVILNQEALNGNLRKALKEKEISEIAEIEKRYLAEKDKENERNNRREERRIEDLERLKKDELNSAVSNLRVFASQNKAFSEIYKTAAISRTIISTYEGAQNSFTSLSSIPVFGTVLGATAAAAAVAGGLARVQQIQSQKFADGGIVPGNGNTDSVPSMLTPGEMVLNREQQQRLLEGGTGTRIETVHIHVNGSGSPQETAATIEETLHNIKDQSMRMSTI